MPSLADYLLANTSGGNFGTMSPGEEAAAVTPGSVLDAAARNAYQAIQNQPSWLEQAAAVRAQSNPNSLRPTPAEIDFASGMVGPTALGIKAYHGSPHDFERFDIGKIGTGEGAQAYGHGLYFAENPKVTESYKTAGPEGGRQLDVINGKLTQLAREMEKYPRETYNKFSDPRGNELKAEYDRLLEERNKVGKTYEVDINADPEHFLDWDKPFSQQSQHVQDALRSLPFQEHRFQKDMLGREQMGKDFVPQGDLFLEKYREAGIPGIKYLDQGSRGDYKIFSKGGDQYGVLKPDGSEYPLSFSKEAAQAEVDRQNKYAKTSNYVVFDDKLIDILKKYGIAAGIIPAAGAALDRQQQ